jgi:hypothetical protein
MTRTPIVSAVADPAASPMPASLGAHQVPAERLDPIRAHITALAATARAVGDQLPLEANAADFRAVLEGDQP